MRWRVPFLAGAGVVGVTSAGTVWLLAALLAGATGDVVGGLAVVLVAASVVLRVGSASLSAVAGAQAVLGPAGVVAPAVSAASAWVAGAALIAAGASTSYPLLGSVPWGVAASLVVAGPAPRTATDLATRTGAAVAATLAVVVLRRWAPRGLGLLRAGTVVGGGVAVALAVVGAGWSGWVTAGPWTVRLYERGLGLAVAGAALATVGTGLASFVLTSRHSIGDLGPNRVEK
jgi:hypothetical protein